MRGRGDAAPAKPKPRVVPIAEPGALTVDFTGGLLVVDRKAEPGRPEIDLRLRRADRAVKGGPGNSLYVADAAANAIFRIEVNGGAPRRVGGANGPINLAVDASSNVYVSEISGARRELRIARSDAVRVLVR